MAVPGVLEDPNFRRTVVLLLEHGSDEGALGVVLNRPLDTPVGDAFPDWHDSVTAPPVLFRGGPVAPSTIIALGQPRPGQHPDGWEMVLDGDGFRIATVDLRRDAALLADVIDQVRVFAGYSGWAAGQLEHEIAQGAWWVADADRADAFADDPSNLWRRVVRRQRGDVARFAHFPDDPSLN